ncbi:MAG: energy-coupling factor ABC transporter permease [Deltaproteobacteria bacterium]|nr:energy-coupling factor ABC transporter permease [Deltaproteobacteria bacterium]
MHMADALISPTVGGVLWTVSAGTIAYCSNRVKQEINDRKIPLMGVFGAFVFAAQMINFAIPATGSSGHLGGGLLLAILLGPHAAFLSIASVLMVQALFFADGGLLALGCNIINLGFFPAFIAYPWIYKRLVGRPLKPSRIFFAAVVSAVIGLQLGALGVVLQTVASGVAALPFSSFLMLMQPIHLAIGIIEGIVTAFVVLFVYRARPEILDAALRSQPIGQLPQRTIVVTFLVASFTLAGGLSWLASESPDGLEWSIAKLTGAEELPPPSSTEHVRASALQDKTAIMRDYAFPPDNENENLSAGQTAPLSTGVAGVVGGMVTLMMCAMIGLLLRKCRK